MKKSLFIGASICLAGALLTVANPWNDQQGKNPTLSGDFYLDSDHDSDIDPGAENWTHGYFNSETVEELPKYDTFHDWLKQMTHLYKWRMLRAEEKNGYYFALFAIGMNSSELAFCFRDTKHKAHPLEFDITDVNGRNVRLMQWGANASLVQEYNVHNPKTGEVIKSRELNGYIIRMHRFPRHLRVKAYEVNGRKKLVFNEMISNVVDSVRNIQNIGAEKLPDVSTVCKWAKAVSLPSWQVCVKEENKYGFFAVFKLNDKTIAFCRQLKDNPGIYERQSSLKFLKLDGKPLPLKFTSVLTLNRRYRLTKMVDKQLQLTKYSIIDGATYRTLHNLPKKFRLQFSMSGDDEKSKVFFDRDIDLDKQMSYKLTEKQMQEIQKKLKRKK